MSPLYESDLEKWVIALLQKQGYTYLSQEEQAAERQGYSNVVFRDRLKAAIDDLNPDIPHDARAQALREVLSFPRQSLFENNETFHEMLTYTDGVSVEYQQNGDTLGGSVRLIDFKDPATNNLVVCNQFKVVENDITRIPDVVLLINGLPLVVIELKNPTDETATVRKAFTQLQNYKNAIPGLFHYNGVLVASDGLDAKAGSLTAGWSRFMAWKTVDGVREDKSTVPQLETLIKGMLRPDVLLDLIKQFSVFEKTEKKDAKTGLISIESTKKIAAYHQYHAVNKAVASTKAASGEGGDRKIGVVWHTQGSGKSLSMLFYVGKLIAEPGNPTIVLVTDRNNLDDQLFDETFAINTKLLRQTPIQATNRSHLKRLLKTAGGGVIFTTIQKFLSEYGVADFELLSVRKNIVVIADEAHRSQYGFRRQNGNKRRQRGHYLRICKISAGCPTECLLCRLYRHAGRKARRLNAGGVWRPP